VCCVAFKVCRRSTRLAGWADGGRAGAGDGRDSHRDDSSAAWARPAQPIAVRRLPTPTPAPPGARSPTLSSTHKSRQGAPPQRGRRRPSPQGGGRRPGRGVVRGAGALARPRARRPPPAALDRAAVWEASGQRCWGVGRVLARVDNTRRGRCWQGGGRGRGRWRLRGQQARARRRAASLGAGAARGRRRLGWRGGGRRENFWGGGGRRAWAGHSRAARAAGPARRGTGAQGPGGPSTSAQSRGQKKAGGARDGVGACPAASRRQAPTHGVGRAYGVGGRRAVEGKGK
jgi:hypothetical protein